MAYKVRRDLRQDLQDVLDDVELVESDDEQIKLIASIEHEVKEKASKKQKGQVVKPNLT